MCNAVFEGLERVPCPYTIFMQYKASPVRLMSYFTFGVSLRAQIFHHSEFQPLVLIQEWNALSFARSDEKKEGPIVVFLLMTSEIHENPNLMFIPKVSGEREKRESL